MAVFKALGHRPFALLWAGHTTSRLGDAIYTVALAWWVLVKTGSGAALGGVLIFSAVPTLIFLLFGGVLADRFPRLHLMIFSDLARGITMCVIALLALSDTLAIWHVYILNLIFGIVRAFFTPAYRAARSDVTPANLLNSANALTSLSTELCGIVGPALGAALVALGSPGLAFGLNSLSFFVSVACILFVAKEIQPGPPKVQAGVMRDLGEGLAAVFRSPWLWVTILMAAFSTFAYAGAEDVALPFLVKNALHADVGVYGLIDAFTAAGAVLGAIWLGHFSRIRRRGLVLYGAWIFVGVLIFVCGLPVTVVGVVLAWFAIGVCNSFIGITWVGTLQETVSSDLLGRVTSIDYLGSELFVPFGLGVAGWATDLFGPQQVFLVGGLLMAGIITLGLLHPKVRGMD